ncbi:hypothetical protein JKP88DRAFT_285208 [Tribonema minus]|uniref:Uncharacterized protein n=1 Tax=Tribonema minus TaxID=303371 RepID=A0A835ZBL2_9STRA|nr:hypothetical protein JKP88DRAFT_285208 [Tribonema minus]
MAMARTQGQARALQRLPRYVDAAAAVEAARALDVAAKRAFDPEKREQWCATAAERALAAAERAAALAAQAARSGGGTNTLPPLSIVHAAAEAVHTAAEAKRGWQ